MGFGFSRSVWIDRVDEVGLDALELLCTAQNFQALTGAERHYLVRHVTCSGFSSGLS